MNWDFGIRFRDFDLGFRMFGVGILNNKSEMPHPESKTICHPEQSEGLSANCYLRYAQPLCIV